MYEMNKEQRLFIELAIFSFCAFPVIFVAALLGGTVLEALAWMTGFIFLLASPFAALMAYGTLFLGLWNFGREFLRSKKVIVGVVLLALSGLSLALLFWFFGGFPSPY